MKRIGFLCLILTVLMTSLFTGCRSNGNTLLLQSGEFTARVTAIHGNEITVSVGDGMGYMREGNAPDGQNGEPGGELATGEIGGMMESGGDGGEMPPEIPGGIDGQNPGGQNSGDPNGMDPNGMDPNGMDPNGLNPGFSSPTAVLTLSDTSVLFREQNGEEVSASLSDIVVGSTLKITLGDQGKPTKIVIVDAEMPQVSLS